MNETVTHSSLEDCLRKTFGFSGYREGQEEVVTRLDEGHSVLAIFPTGAGKSLCYQLPAMVLNGLTLVISPLVALMKDQLDFLIERGIPAARLDSTLSREENLHLYDSLNAGKLKMLYVSPERLSNERFLRTIERHTIALLAIDEAHCISEWGHNFRPDYLKIARLARELNVERVLALTATATPAVARDISNAFDIADVVHTGFYRPNLMISMTACAMEERNAILLSRLRQRPPAPTIVYVTLQRTAQEVAQFLVANGINARAYHAGMKTEERSAVQEAFMASKESVIVATIAFGMGVDKADIRYVYHYNLPKGLESYSQEIGRAGRDGETAICELLASPEDVVVLQNFSYGDTPDPEAVNALLSEILTQKRTFSVSIHALSNTYDIRPLVVQTLLTYLELEGVIESTGPFYSEYKFKPLISSDEMFVEMDKERVSFLRQIFSRAEKKKTWFSLDVDQVAEAIGKTREPLVAALASLEEVGMIELQVSGVRQGYRMGIGKHHLQTLSQTMNNRFDQREKNDIARIQQVCDFVRHDGCLTRYLLAYFGEEQKACGHCSYCRGRAAQRFAEVDATASIHLPLDPFERVCRDNREALRTARQIARFLCGIASPATTRAKLRNHPLYGILESIPFQRVIAFAEERARAGKIC